MMKGLSGIKDVDLKILSELIGKLKGKSNIPLNPFSEKLITELKRRFQ